MRELAPDVVVADILTLAPALAAELDGRPRATLIPHVHPHGAPGFPIYSLGARLPRTAAGRAFWRQAQRAVRQGARARPRRAQPDPRARRARRRSTTSTAASAASSRSSPPSRSSSTRASGLRTRTSSARSCGSRPRATSSCPAAAPAGVAPDAPLVLVAPSTAQDSEHTLLRAALRGLADAPVRVLATYNRRLPPRSLPVPANARVVDWVSYSRTMPHCDVVVCHVGHGTLVRALSSGCAVVACPAVGDMNENAARVAWAGAGVRVPRRFVTPRALRLAVERALGDPAIRARAREVAAWAGKHDAGETAARLVEGLAERADLKLVG